MRLHTHSDCPWSFEFPVSEGPSLQRRDTLEGWAFLRLRPGLHKAQVTDALLGKSIHPAATLGWRVPVLNYGRRNCALQSEVTLRSAKGRIYLVTVPDCFGVGRRILLIFRKYAAFICIVTIKLHIAFVIQEKL